MGLATVHNLVLFNYRGSSTSAKQIVTVSGRKECGQFRDGVELLCDILVDAKEKHGINSLLIPKKAKIVLNGK